MHLTGYITALLIITNISWVCGIDTTTTQADVPHTDSHQQVMQTTDLNNLDLNLVDEGSGELPSGDEQLKTGNEFKVTEILGRDYSIAHDAANSTDSKQSDTEEQHETTKDVDQTSSTNVHEKGISKFIPVIDDEFDDITEDDKAKSHNSFLVPNGTAITHLPDNDLQPEFDDDLKMFQDDAQTKSHPHSEFNIVKDFLPANNDFIAMSEDSDKVDDFSGEGDNEETIPIGAITEEISSGEVPPEVTQPPDSQPAISLPLAASDGAGHRIIKVEEGVTRHPVHYAGSSTKEKCRDVSCESMYPHLHVTTSSSGGLTIPSGAVLVIRCTARTFTNVTVNTSWELPSRNAIDSHHSLVNRSDYDEDEARISETEEIIFFSGNKQQVIIKKLTVANITAEDAGVYTCLTFIPQHCCQKNTTLTITIYDPPSYAAEYAIVGAVCFIEFLVIIYFKSKSHRKKKRKAAQRTTNGCSADYHRLPGVPQTKEKFEEVRQPLT